MKTNLIFLLTAAMAFAEDAKPPTPEPLPLPRKRVIPSPPGAPGGAGSSALANRQRTNTQTTPDSPGLSRNVTLAFKGVLNDSAEIDLELTGNGPRFTSDQLGPASEDPSLPRSIITVNATVTERDGQYRVEYQVGARVALPTNEIQSGGGKVSRNIEYRDFAVIGSVITEPGRPVTLSKANGKSITLTLSLP